MKSAHFLTLNFVFQKCADFIFPGSSASSYSWDSFNQGELICIESAVKKNCAYATELNMIFFPLFQALCVYPTTTKMKIFFRPGALCVNYKFIVHIP